MPKKKSSTSEPKTAEVIPIWREGDPIIVGVESAIVHAIVESVEFQDGKMWVTVSPDPQWAWKVPCKNVLCRDICEDDEALAV